MILAISSLASAAMFATASFQCPQCDAVYQVVRVEAEVERDVDIHCPVCRAPLQGRDGRFILKYFLMGSPKRSYAAAHPHA
jgi:transposase-like protein